MDDIKQESVEDILEKNKTYVELLSQVNNSLVWVLDRNAGTYLYLSPNFRDYIKCDPSELKKKQPLEFITGYIHPDDLAILIDTQTRFLDFVANLPGKEQMDYKYYKHIFGFRALLRGEWIRVTDQRQLLGISSDNRPVILGIVDISPDQTDMGVNYKLINFKTGNIVSFESDKSSGFPIAGFNPETNNYRTVDVETIFEQNRLLIEFMVRMNNSCVYVLERKDNTLLYMSPNFSKFWDYEPPLLKVRQSTEYIVRHLHPDDIAAFVKAQDKVLKFLYTTLSDKERLDYKYICELRALHKGVWTRIISQHWLLGISSDNTPVVMGVVDLSPNQNSNQTFSIRLINNKTGEIISFPFSTSEDTISNSLSRRELEILKMAGEGMLSKEISEKLFISVHTVNGHRQKIFKKMNVQNLTEAINIARREGLLA